MVLYQLGKMRLKMVIVEASEHLRTMLSVMVKPIKGEVYLADNAEAGFTLAKMVKPDLIIADYGLDGSGVALCQRVRQDAVLEKTPFVMMSSFGAHLSLAKYLGTGSNQLVYKPFRCMDLYVAIREALADDSTKERQLIPVMYRTGECDLIDASILDELIKAGEVDCFRRSNGVVMIGRDPIRSQEQSDYQGSERRCAAG
jgi:DNA-binding response OmpR family regulator